MSFHFLKTIKNTIKHWYLPLIAGLILIAAGIYTFAQPEDAYVALAFLFALSFVLSGFFETSFAFANRAILDGWGWNLAMGLLTLIVGVLMFINPEISMLTLPFYVGFVILFRSIAAVSFALELRNYRVMSWGNLMVIGVLGILLAFILLWNPVLAGMSVVIWTGLALIMVGIFNLMASFQLKKLHDLPKKISSELMKRRDEIEDQIIAELDQT